MKILIVDDSYEIRECLKAVLKYREHTIIEAMDGADGLYKFRYTRFDMVITDIQMPLMNGLEMVQYIRKLNVIIPILVWSSEVKDYLQDFYNWGGNWLIQKDKMKELVDIVIRVENLGGNNGS